MANSFRETLEELYADLHEAESWLSTASGDKDAQNKVDHLKEQIRFIAHHL